MKKVHIITGGSSGIGLECAKNFTDGVVLITGRNKDRLIRAKEELKASGIELAYKTSDISDRESLKALFDYAKTLGEIKTVVNSAGVSGVDVDAKLTFLIDLVGAENLIQESLEHGGEKVVLVLISSMMGHVVPANEAHDKLLENSLEEGAVDALIKIVQDRSDLAYNFSKRGVHLLVKKYTTAFGEKGGRIVSVSPGVIMTPMSEKAATEHPEQMNYMKTMTPAKRNGKAEDIAYAVSFMADDRASFITGTDLVVDGGLAINLPKIMAAQANK